MPRRQRIDLTKDVQKQVERRFRTSKSTDVARKGETTANKIRRLTDPNFESVWDQVTKGRYRG